MISKNGEAGLMFTLSLRLAGKALADFILGSLCNSHFFDQSNLIRLT